MSSPLIAPTPQALSPASARLPRRIAGGIAVCAAAAGSIVAWQGLNTLHAKPGEEALSRLAPQESLGAVAVDLKPSSWEQMQVMRQIRDAVNREQLPADVTRSMEPALKNFPMLRDVKPYLTGSGALAIWQKPGANHKSDADFLSDSSRIAVFWSVSSPDAVAAVLSKYEKNASTLDGVKVAQLILPDGVQQSETPDTFWYSVLGSYVVVGNTKETVQDAAAVWQGKHPALASDAEYKALRPTLPTDANLITYASTAGMRLAQQQGRQASDMPDNLAWRVVKATASSATLRQDGIRFDTTAQSDDPRLNALRSAPKLDPRLIGQMPDGALGIIAFSQPRAFFDTGDRAMQSAAGDQGREWRDGRAQFEKESGLSIDKDLLPGFNGDVAVAVYSGDKKQPIKWVGMLTDARGAQPGAMLQKVQAAVEKQKPDVTFTSKQEGAVTYWTMPRDKAASSGLNASLAGLAAPSDSGAVTLYAQVNQSALTASSRSLLEDTVRTYQAPHIVTEKLPKGAQMLVVLRPAQVLSAIVEKVPQAFSSSPVSAQEVSDLFGGQDIVASGSYGPQYLTGSSFVPLRYDKAVALVARLAREQKKGTQEPPTIAE